MYWWHGAFHEPEADVKLEWPLLKRVFSYFVPYWGLALIVLACIGAAAALGLVPAIVTRDLINYLTGPAVDQVTAHDGGHATTCRGRTHPCKHDDVDPPARPRIATQPQQALQPPPTDDSR